MKITIETSQNMKSTGESVAALFRLIGSLEVERQSNFPGLPIVFDDVQVTLLAKPDGEASATVPKALFAIKVNLAGTSMQDGLLPTSLGWGPDFTEDDAFNELWSGLLHMFGWNLVEALPDEPKGVLRAVQRLQRRVPTRDDGWVRALEVSGEGIEDAELKLRALASRDFLQEEKRAFAAYGYKLSTWAEPYVSPPSP